MHWIKFFCIIDYYPIIKILYGNIMAKAIWQTRRFGITTVILCFLWLIFVILYPFLPYTFGDESNCLSILIMGSTLASVLAFSLFFRTKDNDMRIAYILISTLLPVIFVLSWGKQSIPFGLLFIVFYILLIIYCIYSNYQSKRYQKQYFICFPKKNRLREKFIFQKLLRLLENNGLHVRVENKRKREYILAYKLSDVKMKDGIKIDIFRVLASDKKGAPKRKAYKVQLWTIKKDSNKCFIDEIKKIIQNMIVDNF